MVQVVYQFVRLFKPFPWNSSFFSRMPPTPRTANKTCLVQASPGHLKCTFRPCNEAVQISRTCTLSALCLLNQTCTAYGLAPTAVSPSRTHVRRKQRVCWLGSMSIGKFALFRLTWPFRFHVEHETGRFSTGSHLPRLPAQKSAESWVVRSRRQERVGSGHNAREETPHIRAENTKAGAVR